VKNKLTALAAVLLLSAAGCGQEQTKLSIEYVALGDSLAAGQTPYSEIGSSYADIIAEKLDSAEQLAAYTKELAVPGYTTDNVVEQLESEEATDLVKSANLITISAGANDLLRLVQLNTSTGTLEFNEERVDEELEDVQENMESILSVLKSQAPDAQIYVMGYYFPFPQLEDDQKAELAQQLDRLNETLKTTAEEQAAVFVPVDDAFGEDAIDKLPNAEDIHPNREGYEAMAEAFFDLYENQ